MEEKLAELLNRSASGTWATASVVVSGKLVANYKIDSEVPISSLEPSDISALPSLFAGKVAAMEAGVPLRRHEGFLYSIHQFYPSIRQGLDVLYGRGGDASAGEGVAVVRLFPTPNTTPSAADSFVVVTYRLPIVSALAVPKLLTFAEKTLKPLLYGTAEAS